MQGPYAERAPPHGAEVRAWLLAAHRRADGRARLSLGSWLRGCRIGEVGAGRLCRRQMSSSLLAVGSGPEVGLVGGVALQGPAAFVGEVVVEGAEPGGVVEAVGSAVAPPDDVVEVDDGGAAVGEGASSAVAGVGGAAGGAPALAAGVAAAG